MARALTSPTPAPPFNPGNIPHFAPVSLPMSAGPLTRIRDLWLERRSRCQSCGYSLSGLIETEGVICPECGRVVRLPIGSDGAAMAADGRDSLGRIIARGIVVGVAVVMPWMIWLALIVWRISLQRKPTDTTFELTIGMLVIFSVGAITWSAHAATVGSVRLFNLIVRALISVSASAFSGWLTHLALWWGWKWLN